MDKKILRAKMLQMRKALPPGFVSQTAKRVGSFIASLEIFQRAETVMLYCDYKNEVGTGPLLTYALKKKKTVLPLTDGDFCIQPYFVESEEQLSVSSLGILEPDPQLCSCCPAADIDLILVPGLAFDVFGARLGYGKGCYDRFLPKLRPEAPVVGLGYDFQVLNYIPSEAYDRPVDGILTEKGLLEVAQPRNRIL